MKAKHVHVYFDFLYSTFKFGVWGNPFVANDKYVITCIIPNLLLVQKKNCHLDNKMQNKITNSLYALFKPQF